MDAALTYIYYAWKKTILFLINHYIDNDNTVALFYVFMGICLIGMFIRYALPAPRRNKL